MAAASRRPWLSGELDALLRDYVGRPTPLTFAPRLSRELGYRDLSQAGGSRPHGGAQDQQHDRSGADRETPGKRRVIAETGAGSARRRDRHRRGALRAPVRRLHGRGGHAAAGAERLADAAAGRRGRRRSRPASARSRRRSTRRCATGPQRYRDTHYVFGTAAGPASLPGARPRPAARDRRRGSRDSSAIAEGRDPDARGRVRGRRLQRDRDVHRVRRRARRPALGHRGGRARRRGSATIAARSPWGSRASCTGPCRTCFRTRDGQVALSHSISAGLDYPGVGPEHSYLKDDGLATYAQRNRCGGHRRVPGVGPDGGHPSRRSSRRTRSGGCCAGRSLRAPRSH